MRANIVNVVIIVVVVVVVIDCVLVCSFSLLIPIHMMQNNPTKRYVFQLNEVILHSSQKRVREK